jgi:zinc protease
MAVRPNHHPPLARKHPIDPAALAARLTGRARSAGARVQFVSALPFGATLQLHRYRFGNGLDVLILSDPSTPLASYQTWFRVGSRHEKKGKTGLAHLFEHLMFNQTRNLPHGEFDRRIESAGGETNASTWTDWTHYHTDLPASELPTIVALEAERMQNLVLRVPQVRSEKEVVANERRFRVDDDVEGEVSERMYALAYRRHTYHHPTIGWMQDIQNFTTEDCRNFYRTYYAPNNATVVVAGDVDEAKLLGLMQRLYGPIPAADIPPPPSRIEPRQTHERSEVLRRPTPSEKLAIGYHAPSFGDADYPVLSLINEILFIGRSSRMFQLLVRKEQIATDVHGSIAPFVDPGLYDIWVSLRPGCTARSALRLLDRELARLCRQRVSSKELGRVKARAELGFLMALENASGKAEQIGFYDTVLGDPSLIFERLERFRAISAGDVLRVAQRVFDKNQRTRIEVVPKPEAKRSKSSEARA